MINPYKDVVSINNFFVSRDTDVPLVSAEISKEALVKACKPDMNWIYDKCMMKSKEYREMIENNNKATISLHPLLKKDPEIKKKAKKRMLNSYDNFNFYDLSIMTPVFNNCSVMYQENCRRFYESKGLAEKFQLE